MKKQDLTHISSMVKSIAKPIFDKQGIHTLKLIEDWNLIIDKKWQNQIFVNKIAWNNNNQGILYLYTSNNLVKQLILHDSKNLLESINQYFGYNCIVKIKFI